jgi:hypothetical protein
MLQGDNSSTYSPPATEPDPAVSATAVGANLGLSGGMASGGGAQPQQSPPQFPTYNVPQTVGGGGGGIGPGLKLIIFIVTMLIIGSIAVPIIFAVSKVDEAFDSVPDISFGNDGSGGSSDKAPVELTGAYKSSRSLVADLKNNGIRCTNLDVATRSSVVEVGTCYVKGDPVNIQVYFNSTGLNGVLGAMGNLKDSNVVHKANWILLVPTSRSLARDIKRAIGGKLE